MTAGRARVRRNLSLMDIAAITTLPTDCFIFLKDLPILYICGQFKISRLMLLLYQSDVAERCGHIRKALFLGSLGKTIIKKAEADPARPRMPRLILMDDVVASLPQRRQNNLIRILVYGRHLNISCNCLVQRWSSGQVFRWQGPQGTSTRRTRAFSSGLWV